MAQFDTRVQELKYQVLKEVARSYFNDTLLQEFNEIPTRIIPGPKPTMRCCIYKERAIVMERMKMAMGGSKDNKNVIEVIKIACDDCPLGGYEVTNRCRGCIAHRCEKVCPRQAISFDPVTHSAHIDKNRCVNCGMCAKACQYEAIHNYKRPCEQACKLKAITMDEEHLCEINDEKCVQCGACVYQCPFGAIMDKSYITHVIDLLKDSDFSKKYPVYAVVAPSIASQFKGLSVGQIVSGIEHLGFAGAIEAALGADLVSYKESLELAEKGFLTSSCCPAFVSFVKKNFPDVKDNISTNLSPMATIAKWIKDHEPNSHIVFIGPCIAKKMEVNEEPVKDIVDYTLTFEELQALLDARDIDLTKLEEKPLNDASYYGRIFARSGGLTEAVRQALSEHGLDFDYKPITVDGLDNCRLALNKANSMNREFNFIEGMACTGGCIGGPCSLSHEIRNKMDIEKHGQEAKDKSIYESTAKYRK